MSVGELGGVCFLIVVGLILLIFVLSYLALRKWRSES